jgi:hypothetical protein
MEVAGSISRDASCGGGQRQPQVGGDEKIEGHVMRLGWHRGYNLQVKTDAASAASRNPGQQPVIVSCASTEASAASVEG